MKAGFGSWSTSNWKRTLNVLLWQGSPNLLLVWQRVFLFLYSSYTRHSWGDRLARNDRDASFSASGVFPLKTLNFKPKPRISEAHELDCSPRSCGWQLSWAYSLPCCLSSLQVLSTASCKQNLEAQIWLKQSKEWILISLGKNKKAKI